VGRDGLELQDAWDGRPRALYGITVPSFPNFFLLYGPGTNLASGGSIIAASEASMTHVSGLLDLLVRSGRDTIEPTRDAYDEWFERTQDEMRRKVWASPHIAHNSYRNERGEVLGLNPFRFVDHWRWTRTVDPDQYVLR
jgi:4-hydroxyacetophenone monooxygenase